MKNTFLEGKYFCFYDMPMTNCIKKFWAQQNLWRHKKFGAASLKCPTRGYGPVCMPKIYEIVLIPCEFL